ncbi:MAG: hypothetical protein DMF15_00005 [Verrucomicrobia bacterium]|nr:MAG: hypothetical protein DMF15_00005 [Verrucomicrobiota bacterium]
MLLIYSNTLTGAFAWSDGMPISRHAVFWMLDCAASFGLCSLTSTLGVGRWTLSACSRKLSELSVFFFPT